MATRGYTSSARVMAVTAFSGCTSARTARCPSAADASSTNPSATRPVQVMTLGRIRGIDNLRSHIVYGQPEAGSRTLEAGSWKLEAGSRQLKAGSVSARSLARASEDLRIPERSDRAGTFCRAELVHPVGRLRRLLVFPPSARG